jgi:hypothetical protein
MCADAVSLAPLFVAVVLFSHLMAADALVRIPLLTAHLDAATVRRIRGIVGIGSHC